MRRPLLALAALAFVAPAPAEAARPSDGAPTKAQPVVTFEGEAAGYGVNLIEQVMRLQCRQPFCDGFVISVPPGLPKGTRYVLEVKALESSGFTDLFMTDPPGTKTYYAGVEGDPANEVVLVDPAPGDWLAQIWTNAPAYLTAGRYTGRLELKLPVLPPPA